MRPWNPHGQTFNGDPITGFVPAGIRVHGPPLTPQQAAYAHAAFSAFCSRVRLSVVNNPQAQGRLPDGTRYVIECVNKSCAITVFTDDVAGPGQEEKVKFYVDTGWLIDNEPEEGLPTRASDGRYTVKSTGSASTWATLKSVLGEHFVDTFENSGAKSGQSFGRGISYVGMFGTPLTNRMATDAALLIQKKKALGLIGRCTGLLRCWVKGAIGRRLRDTPGVVADDPTYEIFGFVVHPGRGGVLVGEKGFTYVQIGGTTCSMTPLTFPEQLRPLWELMKNPTTSEPGRIMLATYMLAYASADKSIDTYSLEYFGMESSSLETPLVGGWRFSLFSNKCVSVGMHTPSDGVILFSCTEIEFSERQDEDGKYRFYRAAVDEFGENRWYPSGMSPIWYATSEAMVHRLSAAPTPPPFGAEPPIVNAFYTRGDELTLVRAKCVEYSESGTTTDEVKDTQACGTGISEQSTTTSNGMKVGRQIHISGGVDHTDTRRSTTSTTKNLVKNERTGMTVRMDSAGGWAGSNDIPTPSSTPGGYCAVTALGGTPGSGVYGTYLKYWYADQVRYQGWESYGGAELNVIVLHYSFPDSQMWAWIDRRERIWSWSKNTQTNIITGVRAFNSSGNEAVYDAFNPVQSWPGSGGGIPGTNVTVYESGTEYPRKSGAAVTIGEHGNDEFLSFASEGYYNGSALEVYVLAPVGSDLEWGPECVQSAHMHVWANICPFYESKAIAGPDSIIGKLPIGAE